MDSKRKKIVVALSGGVDSAVAAALLKKQGYDVIGVHFIFTKRTWKLSFQVKEMAEKLGIPLKIVDARKEFQKRVIDYFVSSYKKDLTPNPCVVCNKEMKFRLLFDLMKKLKADCVATGHYARISKNPNFKIQMSNQIQNPKSEKIFTLLQAVDKQKDQSYFLYRLTQKDLSKIIFPLGNYTKVEVKKIARKLRLPISDGEESQDICFLQNRDISSFLKKYIKPNPGNITDKKGNILARHKGLPFYTIGQRKGIAIGGTGPYFVVGKNARKNELIVTNDEKKLNSKKFEATRANWINKGINLPLSAKVQIRYHADKFPAIIKPGRSGNLIIETKKPLRAVTPGQSAVFYKNNEILGGGIII
ncbi:MAG: tRNA 2-thiouridine(34) synthase MnmA [Candidatus Moranbacteria bacterium]|nr:tRNA 2-thiouridine(34) synthase MnmA [Candidatus Moranbacteria bacterium]